MQWVPTLLGVYQWLQSSVVRKMKEVYQDPKGTGRVSNVARLCLQWSSKRHKAYIECCKRTWSFPGCGAIWMESILSRGTRTCNGVTLILQYQGTDKAQNLGKWQAFQQSRIRGLERNVSKCERWGWVVMTPEVWGGTRW